MEEVKASQNGGSTNGVITEEQWRFRGKEDKRRNNNGSGVTVREVRTKLAENLNPNDKRTVLPFANGDPSLFPCFRTCQSVEDAVIDTLRSAKFNCYGTAVGLPSARLAVAEYLSSDLPYKVSADDVFLTIGCTQAIDVALSSLARPGANILLPTPGYPYYEAYTSHIGLETRHYELIPDKGWEVDLDNVEAVADANTVALVIINPGNPCGNVYSYQHLQQVAETARKLGILVISDEVYGHLVFGSKPFIPMGVFGDIAPVITLGSISKRWIVPGWRLGWLVINDTRGILKKFGIVESIHGILNLSPDPATFIQAAIPQILKKTKEEFFTRVIDLIRLDADICYKKLKEIPCISCPYKPEGCMFVMAKLNMSLLDDIHDDIDFCIKLAKEENMIVLPGVTLGLKNWLRITFALEPAVLEDGLDRIKAFCQRHANNNKQSTYLPSP